MTTLDELFTRARQRIESIQAELAAIPDEQDIPRNETPREMEARWRRGQTLRGENRALQVQIDRIVKCDASLAPLDRWRDVLLDAEKQLTKRMDAIPKHARDRTRELEREAADLKFGRLNISDGCEYVGGGAVLATCLDRLLREAGYQPRQGQLDVWSAGFGCLPATKRRIAEIEKTRDEAIATLEKLLGTPPQLLAAPATEHISV